MKTSTSYKRTNINIFGVFFLFLIFQSLSLKADVEPNNNVAQANTINLNMVTSSTIGAGGDDLDFYIVQVSTYGRLTLDDHTSGNLQYNIYLYDTNGTTLIKSFFRYIDNSGSRIAVSVSPGSYIIRIDRYGTSNGNYTINPKFEQSVNINEVENNDVSGASNNLILNTNNGGTLGHRKQGAYDDKDWWKITITKPGRLILKDSTQHPLQYDIRLYDADASTLIASRFRYNDNSGGRISVSLHPGTYYLCLDAYGSGYDYYGSYKIFAEFSNTIYLPDIENNDEVNSAQPLQLNKLNSGNLGHRKQGLYDDKDWWKITITEPGRLVLKDSTQHPLQYDIRLYDADASTLIASRFRYNDNSGGRIGISLLPGTYYLQLDAYGSGYDYYGSYKIWPEFTITLFPPETEENDVANNATPLILNKTNSGNLGHRKQGKYDDKDWWKITITEPGRLILKDSTQSPLQYDIRLYDADASTLIVSRFRYNDNSGGRLGISLLPGIYYIQLDSYGSGYDYYGSYKIDPEFTPDIYPVDKENNDSSHVAVQLLPNTLQSGNLGHRKQGLYDDKDWWLLNITEEAQLIINDSTQSPLQYNIRLYGGDAKTLLKSAFRYNDNSGSRISVKVSPGVYYVQLDSYGGGYTYYGSYKMHTTLIPKPKAAFSVVQNISTVKFLNETKGADTYKWDFGDGTQTDVANPSHTFTEPGAYEVQLIAENEFSKDTTFQTVTIYGIRELSPIVGGNSGWVTVTLMGGGMDDQSTVKLKGNGFADIEGFDIISDSPDAIRVTFNLNMVPLGIYDMEVINVGKPPILKEMCFVVEQGKAADPWVNLSGRTRALRNRWQTYEIKYGNNGNIDAQIVPFFVTISNPDENEIMFQDLQVLHNDFVLENNYEYLFNQRQLYFDVDTFMGEAVKTRIYAFYFHSIPAGFSGSFNMKIKTQNSISIHVWNAEALMENNVLKSFSNNPQLANCLAWAKAQAFLDTTADYVGLLVPGAGCVYNVGKSFYSLGSAFVKVREERMNGKWRPLTSYVGSFLEGTASLFLNCVGDLTKIGPLYKLAIDMTSRVTFANGVYQADKACRDKFGNHNLTRMNVRGVNSFDPNEIVGPLGYGNKNYIAGTDKVSYTIFFENKDTASAPVQEIWVIDTLDNQIFDFSTFAFESFTLGDTTYLMAQGQSEFGVDLDFTPKMDILVRCVGSIDPSSGAIQVYFNALKPSDFTQNEDPELGVLLPNKIKPQGEGKISFTVGLKNVVHDAVFKNQATILFDFNKPIKTNEWSNAFDLRVPESAIIKHEFNKSTKKLTLELEGKDEGAGVERYALFASINGYGFEQLDVIHDKNYEYNVPDSIGALKMFSIAMDSLGQLESPPEIPDADVVVAVKNNKISPFRIYPIPAQETLFYACNQSVTDVEIFSVSGTQLMAQPINQIAGSINVSSLPEGIYFVRFTCKEETVTQKIRIKRP